ncbi:LCP family protein [Patescibacteria group bacterium]
MFFRKKKKSEAQIDGLNPKKDGIDINVKINKTPQIESKFTAGKESIDLENMNTKKQKNNRWKKSGIIAGILIFLVIAWFGGNILGNLYKIFGGNPLLGFLQGISTGRVIDGEADKRINILIMGRGGVGHPGSNLTDTLIVASLDTKKDKVAMISIPRDLYVEYPDNQGHGRINNLYTLGERAAKNTNYKSGFWGSSSEKITGPTYTKNFISKMLDIPIHYYADIDFNGFEKLIDEVGGVTVDVEKSIYDPYYPNRSMTGYEPFYIKAGTQTLDGKTSLKYSRTRKTTSDFDRAKRQQIILVALQDEIKKLNIIKNSNKMYNMLNILGDHVSTDMEIWEMQRLWELLGKSDLKNPELEVFDNANDGILRSTTIGGASVLLPRAGDYSEIRDIVQNIFSEAETIDLKAKLSEEKLQLTIEVWNGTSTTGLAGSVQSLLVKEGYKISKIGNAPATNYTNSQIIDYSKGRFPASLNYFQNKFKAVIVEQGGQLSSNADILIILGASYKESN